MWCRPHAVWLLLASLSGLVPGMLFAQLAVTPAENSSASRGSYFGILGQVAQPGVYELPADRQTLNDLIEVAGGLTANASNNLRVVRGGRNVGQTFFQQRVRFELRPGDVIVSDKRRAGFANGNGTVTRMTVRDAKDSTVFVATPDQSRRAGGSVADSANEGANQAEIVQIGAVGLLARPVVIAIPADKSTLQNVLTTLHQPREGATQIGLIREGGQQRIVLLTETDRTVLATGSVLVFDAKSAQPETLPKLPLPVPWSDRASESSAPESLTPEADLAKPAVMDESAQPTLQLPREAVASSAPTPVVDVTDQFRVEEESKSAPATDHKSQAHSIPAASSPDAVESPRTFANQSLSNGWSTSTLILLAIGSGLTGLLLAGLVRRRPTMALTTTTASPTQTVTVPTSTPRELAAPPATPAPRPASAILLDDLIGNRLTVATEPVTLPKGARIYGQPVERSDDVELRLDAAQPITQPHIRPVINASEQDVDRTSSDDVQDIPRRTSATARLPTASRIDPKSPTREPKLLDRVLENLDRGRSGPVAKPSSSRSGLASRSAAKSQLRGGGR